MADASAVRIWGEKRVGGRVYMRVRVGRLSTVCWKTDVERVVKMFKEQLANEVIENDRGGFVRPSYEAAGSNRK